jgi:hypothetical protein
MGRKPRDEKEGLEQSTSLPGRQPGLDVLADSCLAGRQHNFVGETCATVGKKNSHATFLIQHEFRKN